MQPPNSQSNFDSALALFHQLYGPGAVQTWRAPARINVLGEHVDYVSYLPTASLPFGSHEHAMVLLYRPNQNGEIRGASVNERFPPFRFALSEGPPQPQSNWQEYLYQQPTPVPDWQNYVRGAVFFAQQQYGLSAATGFDFVLTSTIPPQGGSSSSSALVVLAGAAFREVNGLALDRIALAHDSAQAEWYVGTRGGALDHTAICLAERQHAVHLRYREQRTELVPLPVAGYRWVTFFTHAADKGREIMLEYNERAAVSRLLIPACLQAQFANAWPEANAANQHDDLVAMLSELPATITLAGVSNQFPSIYHECQRAFPALVAARYQQPLALRQRALHHWGEARRVQAAVQMLRDSDDAATAMPKLGELLDETHASLRDLYEICTPQINQLHSLLASHPDVLGARLIGGGFGGNVLALTKEAAVPELLAYVQEKFYSPQQREAVVEGAVMVSTPGAGIARQ